VNLVGRKLEALGLYDRADVYEQPRTVLDATVNWAIRPGVRLKASGKNLTDSRQQRLQKAQLGDGDLETWSTRSGRSYSLAVTYGS
jgi:hypothetical protein